MMSTIVPFIVDEAITILLQVLDEVAIKDGKIDLVVRENREAKGHNLHDITESLGSEFLDSWREKFSQLKLSLPEQG